MRTYETFLTGGDSPICVLSNQSGSHEGSFNHCCWIAEYRSLEIFTKLIHTTAFSELTVAKRL
jgi:hypothetical protein